MRIFALCLLIASLGLAGCVTKSQADAQARIAFLQGQNQALMQAQAQAKKPATPQPLPQLSGLNVNIIGPVNNPVIPWRIGLTLAQAIVSAGYTGNTDPSAITIHRGSQDIPMDPKSLLNGEDFVLETGDVIDLQP